MTDPVIAQSESRAIPILAITGAAWPGVLEAGPASLSRQAQLGGFKAGAGQMLLIHDGDGEIDQVLFGLGDGKDAFVFRGLSARLPTGDYALASTPEGLSPADIALAFAIGTYRFDRYRSGRDAAPRLVAGEGVDLAAVRSLAHACALARDMVNTPAGDMGPLQIETIAREIAEQHGAVLTVTTGDELLSEGYPSVHAVGRAAGPGRDPRIIEIAWSGPGAAADAPLVALVGKGVTFDTGGLDIKPSAGMRQMKKDMGGAAHALALARMVMDAALPIRLVVLVPAVENAISGDAMRPGDVLATRKGLTVEVGNTDAEGRLILSDALTRAGEHSPDLTIDLATLTGAARVALGPQVIPFYTDDEALAADISAAAAAVNDPLWRMPLWAGYEDALESDIADLRNDPEPWAQAGSVTAGLFLKRFAPTSGAWVHLDIFAWNPKGRPGWPTGAEAQAIRALFKVLKDRFG